MVRWTSSSRATKSAGGSSGEVGRQGQLDAHRWREGCSRAGRGCLCRGRSIREGTAQVYAEAEPTKYRVGRHGRVQSG